MEERYQLTGCVNDAKLLRSSLINKFNFPQQNIKTLYNLDATQENILNAMDEVFEQIGKDDVFVFQFSGHGHECRVKTETSDEASGTINAILPCDDSEPDESKPDGVIYREIREDIFNKWLSKLAQKTSNTTLIFDACHSGTMTRSSQHVGIRTIPSHARKQIIELSSQEQVESSQSGRGIRQAPHWLRLSDHHVVIAASRDNQYAKELYFQEGEHRFKHGVLSYSLNAALQKATPGTTYRDIFEQVTNEVIAQVDEQNPQIEGLMDRELFGVKDIEPLAFVPVSEVQDSSITISAGLAHGVTIGSIWEVYPPYTKTIENIESIAQISISEVDALESIATFNQGKIEDLEVGARCVLIKQGRNENCIDIYIDNENELAGRLLTQQLKQSSLINLLTQPEGAQFHAKIIHSPEELSNIQDKHRAQLNQSHIFPAWAVFDRLEELAMPLHSVSTPQTPFIVSENAQKIARYNNLLSLTNPNSQLNVEFNIFKRDEYDSLHLANGGLSQFFETDKLVLQIKNLETTKQIFFNVLWLSANREVMHFYPHRKSSEALAPSKTVTIGEGSRSLTASLGNYHKDTGQEIITVIFTSQPTDFTWLNQQGLRSSNPTQNTPRIQCPNPINNALGASSSTQENQTIDGADWQVVSRGIVLTRESNVS